MTTENATPFPLHSRVRKTNGSWWEGKVVGFYSTDHNLHGVAVQLDMVPNGPVQIYPAAALELVPPEVIWVGSYHAGYNAGLSDTLSKIGDQIAALKLHPTTGEDYDSGYIAARNDAFAIVQEVIDNAD